MADVTTARTGIDPTVVGGTRGGSPVDLEPWRRKLGQPPGSGRDPIVTPIDIGKGGNPPGRPITNPPTTPTTPPDRPRPPIGDPAQPPPENPDPPKGGSPGPSPTPMPDDGNFSKGQVRNEQLPGDIFSPFFEAFYGDQGFNAYRGSNQGVPSGGRARTYDPLGIGKDAYTDPNADVWSMTGVNSVLAPGSKVKPRYGVVGGNGGYGYGMVGQDYSGPLADDPRGLVRNLRQQRRQLNRMGHARGGPGVVNGPGGFGPKTGGAGTVTGGSGGQFGPAGDDMNNFKGQPAGGSGGGATGGAGTTTGGQGGKWGAPPPAAGANTGGASPEPALLSGGAAGGGGTGFGTTPGSGGPPSQALLDSLSTYLPSNFNSPFGQLVVSSGGNGNVFKKLEGDDGRLYHWDPQNNWRSMTQDEYRGYGDYNYQDPRQHAAAAGGIKQDFAYNPNSKLIQGKVGTGSYA